MTRVASVLSLLLLLSAGTSTAAAVQRGSDSVALHSTPALHHIHWFEVTAVAGGTAALALLDEPLQRFAQRHRSRATDDVATVFRQAGDPLVFAGMSLGTFAVGTLAGDDRTQRAGARMVVALVVSETAAEGIKLLAGRSRPNDGAGAFSFHPFTARTDAEGVETRASLPSGHTTAAFALATTIADELHSPVASAVLYSAAAGTGWSRINDNRHWLSDTILGAVIGITSAKLVDGRWQIFHLHPPTFLAAPNGALGIGWSSRTGMLLAETGSR